jgi:hypothetical protein
MADTLAIFERKLNPDGTRASICPICHRTIYIGCSNSDQELTEDNHMCDQVIARLIRERMRYGTTVQ